MVDIAILQPWQLKSRTIRFDRLPKLMGVLNVTPDSFSDGGQYYSPQLAVDQALLLEDEGADILDLGGESTRPYSQAIDSEEELRRVVPVLELLQGRIAIPISIDTSKTVVAKAALDLGAEIINDVTGLAEPSMIELASTTKAGVCVMHMQGTPQTMQDHPTYSDIVNEIKMFLRNRIEDLVRSGISQNCICIDPGVGFGKTHEHNLEVLTCMREFHSLGQPLLVGHSRKGFIGKVLRSKLGNEQNDDRIIGSVGVSLAMARFGVQILRIHDVAATKQALTLFEASGGLS